MGIMLARVASLRQAHTDTRTDPHSESLYKDLLIFVSRISSVHKQIKLL